VDELKPFANVMVDYWLTSRGSTGTEVPTSLNRRCSELTPALCTNRIRIAHQLSPALPRRCSMYHSPQMLCRPLV
jgi:hypothetical protein